MCSMLPGWDMMDRLEMVLHPSTRVLVPERMLSPADEIGPGRRMSPEITGRVSKFNICIKSICWFSRIMTTDFDELRTNLRAHT